MSQKSKSWVQKIADRVEARVDRAEGRDRIVCASGVSPSGPIHLGNLREVMTVHVVAEELRRRGRTVDHIHSWDDFDRFRKVPEGLPASFEEHIGRPLAEVPDPLGEHASYADRHIAEFSDCISRLGVELRAIRQAEAYRAGTYGAQIKHAMERRLEIFDILAEFQTAGRHAEPLEARRRAYYPFRVYCHECGRDDTRITAYDPATCVLTYVCSACAHERTVDLNEETPGKLVWKVDWPMRWHFERVDFEPAGEDHSAPTSSRAVGVRIQQEIFGTEPPIYVGYAFVGITGQSKISGSTGTYATPRAALDILEPAILRWLYVRRNVRQAFSIDFGQETLRVYDEWDRLCDKVRSGGAGELETWTHRTCVETSAGPVAQTGFPVSFRLLSSVADLTQGSENQLLRVVREHLEDPPPAEGFGASLEPRLSCAVNWATKCVADEDRTRLRSAFARDAWDGLTPDQQANVRLLSEKIGDAWTLAGLTELLYGVPKLGLGQALDAPPSDEIKVAQREFFKALYALLVGSHTGPRLPTLLLSIGREKALELLGPPDP